MNKLDQTGVLNGPGLQMGDISNHRAFVGVPDYFDRLGVFQFMLLVCLGMRENHTLLDIGCGSLRGGRFSILYLNPQNYCGIEPVGVTLQQGIMQETGKQLIDIKKCRFASNDDFDASQFNTKFDYVMIAGIFMHASKSLILRCFRQMVRTTGKQGFIVGAIMEGKETRNKQPWLYPGIRHYRRRTIADMAESAGLQLQFLHVSHPLNHTWFVASRKGAPGLENLTVNLEAFSFEEYLKFQLHKRQVEPRTYAAYLKEHLAPHVQDNDFSIVPQARP